MYSRQEYDNLKRKYGGYSSWAIWDEKNPKDPSIIESSLDTLNSRYVFLGLNISKELSDTPWQNFHGGRHDRKLMKLVSRSPHLRGSYLTDLFKDFPEAKSSALKNIPEDIIKGHVHIFSKEMEDIGITDGTVFVVLGNDVSGYFKKYFQGKYKNNKIIDYYHYSYYGKGMTYQNWINGLLEKIKRVGRGRGTRYIRL